MEKLNALNGYNLNGNYNFKKQKKGIQSNIGFGAPIKSVKLYRSEARNFNTIDFSHDIFKKYSDVVPKLSASIRNFFKSVDTTNKTFIDAFDEVFEKNKDKNNIVEEPDANHLYIIDDLGVVITKLGKKCVDFSDKFSKNENRSELFEMPEEEKEPITVFVLLKGLQ